MSTARCSPFSKGDSYLGIQQTNERLGQNRRSLRPGSGFISNLSVSAQIFDPRLVMAKRNGLSSRMRGGTRDPASLRVNPAINPAAPRSQIKVLVTGTCQRRAQGD